MRVVLVSRELYPLGGGGIGQFVNAAAHALSSCAEVTVVTSAAQEAQYEALRAENDARLPPPSVQIAFVQEPTADEARFWHHPIHLYSHRVYERLQELFPAGGPDLIEFGDFLGEGFVTMQAAEACDPFLAGTRVCVRIHTSAEIVEVLNGFLPTDEGARAVYAMERFVLRHADRVIWQGGGILETYRRFYGEDGLAPAQRVRYPYRGPVADARADSEFATHEPFRLLYAGRLERRKGVHNLIRAVTALTREDFHLTLCGGDTTKAPLGTSALEQLEQLIADDPRITYSPALDRSDLAVAIRAHDAVVVPSLWECWPYAALEPMHLNRPVLGTPVGGLSELLAAGGGMLTSGTDAIALEEGLERLFGRREELAEDVRAGRPLARARELADEQQILGGYRALAAGEPRSVGRRRAPGSPPPLVSAVVAYQSHSGALVATVDSLLGQSYPRLEVLVVSDGAFDDEDRAVAELSARHPVVVVTQLRQGRGAALNFGVGQSRGRYVFPVDPGLTIAPGFVARAVDVLERRPEVAYVTAWPDGAGAPGGAPARPPLGNWVLSCWDANVAGGPTAVLRRWLFDAGFSYSDELVEYQDWQLYRQLARAGHFGAVIPEALMSGRREPPRMPLPELHARLLGEMEALTRESELQWTSSSA